jgi:hypothetical protein
MNFYLMIIINILLLLNYSVEKCDMIITNNYYLWQYLEICKNIII